MKLDKDDRIPSVPANSRLDVPMGVRRRSLLELDTPAKIQEGQHQADLLLCAGGTLGPPPLFKHTSRPPRRRSEQRMRMQGSAGEEYQIGRRGPDQTHLSSCPVTLLCGSGSRPPWPEGPWPRLDPAVN